MRRLCKLKKARRSKSKSPISDARHVAFVVAAAAEQFDKCKHIVGFSGGVDSSSSSSNFLMVIIMFPCVGGGSGGGVDVGSGIFFLSVF